MVTLSDSQRLSLGAVAVAVVAALCFLPALNNDFVNYDDWNYIFDERTLGGLRAATLKAAFTEFYVANYHPLTWISYLIDIEIAGPDSRWFHGVNIVFHAANSYLLVLLLDRFRRSADLAPILLCATIWAVHPLRVESVAWVSERKDVLFTFFYLCALLVFTGDRRNKMVAAFVLSALSFLAKPMAVSLPVVMWLYLVLIGRKSVIDSTRTVAPFFLLAAVLAAVTVLAQTDTIQDTTQTPILLRIQTALVSTAGYITDTVSPRCLHAPYCYPEQWSASQLIASCAILFFLIAATKRWNSKRAISFGVSWYLVTLIPVSGLVMVGIAPHADRYTYSTIIGLHIACLPLIEWMHSKSRLAVPGLLVVAGSFASLTQPQILTWRSTADLVGNAMTCDPENAPALEAGAVLAAKHGNFQAASELRRRAVGLRPNFAEPWIGLAVDGTAERNATEAKRLWLEVLSINARLPAAHHGLALALFELGEFEAAERELQSGLSLPGPYHRAVEVIVARWRDIPAEREFNLVRSQAKEQKASGPTIREGTP